MTGANKGGEKRNPRWRVTGYLLSMPSYFDLSKN